VTARKRAEEARARYTRELQIINDAVVTVSRMQSIDEICSYIGTTIQKVNPEACVGVSLYDPQSNAIQLRTVIKPSGAPERFSNLLETYFPEIERLSLRESDERINPYATGKLERVPQGLYGLLAGRVPRNICQQVEEVLNLGEVFAIGFAMGDQPYGGISLLLPEGNKIEYPAAIETLASHISILLRQRQAEQL
jgi:hypothetical protein